MADETMIIFQRFLLFVTLFVFYIFEYSNGEEAQITRTYNCIKDTTEQICEDSRIIIDGYFYECEAVLLMYAPPNSIVNKDGEIFFLIKEHAYKYSMGVALPTYEKLPRPQRHVQDSKGNVYFAKDGEAYILKNDSKKEIKIKDLDERFYNERNQIALDSDFNKLFILRHYDEQYQNDLTGKLFSITTNSFDDSDTEVKAEWIESAGNRITAVAIEENQQVLFLGIQENGGFGKFIQMKRKMVDPCSKNMTVEENPIVEVFNELRSKIGQLFEESPNKDA